MLCKFLINNKVKSDSYNGVINTDIYFGKDIYYMYMFGEKNMGYTTYKY